MKQEVFCESFAHHADAPNGVQKLRELILQLAVQGKLVPQDLNDEPASNLLGKIRIEKGRLIHEKRIRKGEPLPQIEPSELSFELPSGWEWVRLGEICTLENGDRSKNYPSRSDFVADGVPFINAGHLQLGSVSLDSMNYISEDRFDTLKSGKVSRGDILFCLRGSLGKSALVTNIPKGAIASSLVIVRLITEMDPQFVLTYLVSPFAGKMIKRHDNGTAQPNLSAADLRKFVFALPPLAEQRRIVATLDQWLALCDELEERQDRKRTARVKLNNAALDSLLAARAPAEFDEHWQRICENFDLLYDALETVSKLRQAILQLAVQGRLVPQDINDEPAAVLLAKISAEKERLIREKKIKKSEPFSPIGAEEVPFDLPLGWEWTYLDGISSNIQYGYTASADHGATNVRMLRITDIQDNKVDWPSVPGCQIDAKSLENYRLHDGDILIARTGGTIGKSFLVRNIGVAAVFASYLIRVVLSPKLLPEYIKVFLESPIYWQQLYAKSMGTGQPNVNGTSLKSLWVSLPPLAEQSRIVAKVDQLTAFCDALESKIRLAEIANSKLMNAAVQHLTK